MSERPVAAGPDDPPTVTHRAAFSRRSLGKQVLFTIITFGFYVLYWFYITGKQLDRGTNENVSPILFFIPIIGIYAAWQMSKASEAVTRQSRGVMFVVLIFFSPLFWYWVQKGINKTAV